MSWRTRCLAAFAALSILGTAACGDDDDVTADDDAAALPTAPDTGATSSTTPRPDPTYEFAVSPEPTFDPTSGVDDAELMEEITTYLYPGEVVPLIFIELDPEGDACPGEVAVELADADGVVIATSDRAEITVPESAAPGAAVLTVYCERAGEPGVGVLQPIVIATLLELEVSPTTVTAGEEVDVVLAGGCPEGSTGMVGLTPEEGGAGVFADFVALGEDGTGSVLVPEALPAMTLYATVQCFDGENLAIAFTPFDVVAAD